MFTRPQQSSRSTANAIPTPVADYFQLSTHRGCPSADALWHITPPRHVSVYVRLGHTIEDITFRESTQSPDVLLRLPGRGAG